MFENIVGNIICSEYDKVLGRKAMEESTNLNDRFISSDPDRAMVIKFSLSLNYSVEEGYRNLTLLIYGFGYNYIGVFAKIDWNVIRNEWSDGDTLVKGRDYIKGETPWILLAYHDSCWRSDGVQSLLWDLRSRINSIDYLFVSEGWYTIKELTDLDKAVLADAKQAWERRERNTRVQELEFQFETNAAVIVYLDGHEVDSFCAPLDMRTK